MYCFFFISQKILDGIGVVSAGAPLPIGRVARARGASERAGAVTVVCGSPDEAAAVTGRLRTIARDLYGAPVAHGARCTPPPVQPWGKVPSPCRDPLHHRPLPHHCQPYHEPLICH